MGFFGVFFKLGFMCLFRFFCQIGDWLPHPPFSQAVVAYSCGHPEALARLSPRDVRKAQLLLRGKEDRPGPKKKGGVGEEVRWGGFFFFFGFFDVFCFFG